MKSLYHPSVPSDPIEVPDADVDSWTEQGWRKTPLREAKESASTSESKAK